VYGEASLRIGRVKNDFRSSDILNADSDTTKYDSSADYYGAHFGLGYIWDINDKASLDLSSKYAWTRQGGDTVSISGDFIKFRAADSQRWRSGARFSYAVNECVTPYVGAYYDHEFDSKARATINGDPIEAPKADGGTGVGELGLTLTPSKTLPLSFDLGVQGYTGKREGVTGSLQMRLEF
jgi:outer membrane autotransporter protein